MISDISLSKHICTCLIRKLLNHMPSFSRTSISNGTSFNTGASGSERESSGVGGDY